MNTDKHLQINTSNGKYQVEMIYVAARKVFEAGKVQPTYRAALEAGARMAVQTGATLLAWGNQINSTADCAEINNAAKWQAIWEEAHA